MLFSLAIIGSTALHNPLSAAAAAPDQKLVASALLGVLNQISNVDVLIKGLENDAEATVGTLVTSYGKKVTKGRKNAIKKVASELTSAIDATAIDNLYNTAGK